MLLAALTSSTMAEAPNMRLPGSAMNFRRKSGVQKSNHSDAACIFLVLWLQVNAASTTKSHSNWHRDSKTMKGCAAALQEGTRSTVTCRRRSGSSSRSHEGLATSLANFRWLSLPQRREEDLHQVDWCLERPKYAAQKRRCRTLLQVLQPAERLLDRKFYRVFMGSGLVNKKYHHRLELAGSFPAATGPSCWPWCALVWFPRWATSTARKRFPLCLVRIYNHPKWCPRAFIAQKLVIIVIRLKKPIGSFAAVSFYNCWQTATKASQKRRTEKRTQPRMALDLAEPKAKVSCTFKLNSAFHVVRSIHNQWGQVPMQKWRKHVHVQTLKKKTDWSWWQKQGLPIQKDAKNRVNPLCTQTSPVVACNREVLVEKMDTGNEAQFPQLFFGVA